MTAGPPACWVCDDTPHLCRCPVWGPAFHPETPHQELSTYQPPPGRTAPRP